MPKATRKRKTTTYMHATKSKKLPLEVLSADEVRALIQSCSNRAPTGIRNRAIMASSSRHTELPRKSSVAVPTLTAW
ncbi:site-specific tyrosine recombinase XerC [Symmachiella macrocystis]|uniref:Site-specific tyrosine recombinase XerC n=1 Tax=Symmachiella macrocystis TaxID=2527985 RepID=A0A5C6BN77_9PLAN|nr:hypothetical protein [Symmachiella macrocystis]TWU12881.1 site-specific tyrosine recombinase XerC [Symmachiella macrocystis]